MADDLRESVMITYRIANLAEAKPFIAAMLPYQWEETGDADLNCEPNWNLYENLERAGAGRLILALDGGRVIGYGAAIVHPHLNAKSVLVATISTYYVEPRQSRGLIERSMIGELIAAMPNVARVFVETEYNHSAGRIFEAMGFRPVKVGYRMDVTPERKVVNA